MTRSSRFISALLLSAASSALFAGNESRQSARFLPRESGPVASPLQIAGIDFLLPGYGTYMQNKTGYAAIYFGANLASLAAIYVAWRNWRFYESAYEAAAVRQAIEPDKLYFQDPAGGTDFYSLQDIKNRAERGQLFFAVSVVANIALRAFSAWHSWSLADEARTQSGPRYEFYPDQSGGVRAQGGYYFYF